MPLPSDSVGECIMFFFWGGGLSIRHVHSFVWTDLVTTISHERLEQSLAPVGPTDNLIRFWRSKPQRSRSQQAIKVVEASTLMPVKVCLHVLRLSL